MIGTPYQYAQLELEDDMISEREVSSIYEDFIESKFNASENGWYKNKYSDLPVELNDDEKWKWEGKDFPRIISLLEFKEFMETSEAKFPKCCILNGGEYEPESRHIKTEEITYCNYEENKEKYDLLNLNLPRKDYDLIVCNQTLEHVQDPCLAAKNIHGHLNKEGVVYTSVPVVSPPHDCPFHFYTGITPVGLGCIFKLANFEILDIGVWGNSEYINHILSPPRYDKLPFPDYKMIKNYQNDFDRPVIAWIFAKKNS